MRGRAPNRVSSSGLFRLPDRRAKAPRISVIVCSIDPRKFEAVTASYRQRFADHALEIVGVHDARSLAEGYNRAAMQAKGDILVFSHDDIELTSPDFAARLLAHLDRYDGIGVAGASKVTGPEWGHAGQRHIHGHVLHAPPADRSGVLLMAAGFQALVCGNIRVLDGVFLALRRHVWEAHRFDADTYDGFHLYDLDFTWRASGGGARLAVPLDLLVLHRSMGRYDSAWRRYARRFVAQAGLDPLAPPSPGGLQARLDTIGQIDSLRAALLHFRYGAPPGPVDRARTPREPSDRRNFLRPARARRPAAPEDQRLATAARNVRPVAHNFVHARSRRPGANSSGQPGGAK